MWFKVFSNPRQHVQEQRLPTARGRAMSALAAVDRHLSEAQRASATLDGDSETKHVHDDVWRRLEDLRWHLRRRYKL